MQHHKKVKRINHLYLALILSLLGGVSPAFAQWSARDSLWLRDVLAGKDTIRLNPEAMQSIQEGSFLNLDKPRTPMRSTPLDLPIEKDFSSYFLPEDSTKAYQFKLTDLPPHIVLRYYNPKGSPGQQFSYEYFYYYLKRSTHGISGGQSHDFAHLLNMAFSPEYRRLMKNRKNAANLRYYNDLPRAELYQKQQQFLSAHPELRKPANAAEAAKMKKELKDRGYAIKTDSLSTSRSSSGPDSVSVVFPEDFPDYKTQPN
ncbi:hypothetical protein [Parabacteroides sp. PF5-6]|uniref:hypothetical protein n=1 Tax=Parabacteroides sp. PF5-6 TaxID=1742403 RepID=UPI002407131B|nr:hypothetical protein [Parabacteroides sp. PF5-6]MDF9829875.1 hypothetical protein [Parabacteroides sp. PF5-6]